MLTVRVMDEQGNPLEDAIVKVKKLHDSSFGKSNSAGLLTLIPDQFTTYYITVLKEGYHEFKAYTKELPTRESLYEVRLDKKQIKNEENQRSNTK